MADGEEKLSVVPWISYPFGDQAVVSLDAVLD